MGIKIEFRCKKCNNRLFDYISGNMDIEMKCTRCKRVMVMKNFTEEDVRQSAVNGKIRI